MASHPVRGVLKSAQLQTHIQNVARDLGPHGRIPSENQLVRTCGVSRGTVGRAIQSLVEQGLLYRIQGKGTFVAADAPQARKRTAGRILMATRAATRHYHPYYSERLRGIVDVLGEAGLAIEVVRADANLTRRLDAAAADEDVHGLILCTTRELDVASLRQAFAKPVVLATTAAGGTAGGTTVNLDPLPALRQLAQRLAGYGHRRVLLLSRQAEHASILQQELPYDATLSVHTYGTTEDSGYETMAQAWHGETALIVADDVVARGVIAYLMEHQVRIPADLSLAAMANAGTMLRAPGPVTVVEIDAYKLGTYVARSMLDLLRDGRDSGSAVQIQARLIDRGSIGPAPRMEAERG